ncbi:hypothetical protein KSS87_014730 [Heliosperma pusillum]|nr:hypothetical protein KSS87_014730 [Heliosperma pusillum]
MYITFTTTLLLHSTPLHSTPSTILFILKNREPKTSTNSPESTQLRHSRRAVAVAMSNLVFLIFFSLLAASTTAPPPPSVDRQPLLLPLSFSSTPIADVSKLKLRRHLHGVSPNARMRLYDDLLSNGYYTTRLWIGTPPQEFALIVDTGSTVTYVPCNSCDQCGNHQVFPLS